MKNIPVRTINTTSQSLKLSENFSIRDVHRLFGGKDLEQELHRHDHYYILALQKGRGSHTIDFTDYKISDYSFFFMRPSQVHALTLKAGSTGYLIQFKADFYYPTDKASRHLLRRASHKTICKLDARNGKKLFPILASMLQEYTTQQEGYQNVIKAHLGIFFIELVRQRQDKKNTPNSDSIYTQDRIEELMGLLETHLAQYKKVSDYAALLNLSPYQLNAITKATMGKTCSALIDEQLILESKRYLLSTANQVSQIAYQLGYEDASYFTRFFKKHTGYTPEAFRQHFR